MKSRPGRLSGAATAFAKGADNVQMANAASDHVIRWLMEGDPAVRWQTMRHLLGSPARTWQAEQRRAASEGWVARLLALQAPDGQWGGGLYSPKWISTTYTLLTLRALGAPRTSLPARQGVQVALGGLLGPKPDDKFMQRLERLDRCIVGMLLQLAVYFEVGGARVEALVQNLLGERMPDGAWNCRRARRPYPHHSSLHTTLNVLDGLREYAEHGGGRLRKPALAAEKGAREFMLQHRLFRSDKTGEIINERFTRFAPQYRWQYDVLRGLSYFARARAPRDPRLQDAIDLLQKKRLPDGRWVINADYSGRVHFKMETAGRPSRLVTLRALRVLRWWNA